MAGDGGGGTKGVPEELETAAVASASGWLRFRRKAPHAAPVGSPCANCGEALQGPWCHACGQLGEDFHRSTPHLIAEAFESLFHFDGRLWRTLPRLLLQPHRLTRDFLDGHRVPQIPPLRLFLVVLLGVFLTGALNPPESLKQIGQIDLKHGVVAGQPLSADDAASLKEANQALAGQVSVEGPGRMVAWLKPRILAAVKNPERFFSVLEQWSERFAFLLMPMSTLLLSLVFVFQRRFYVFDHAIFSLHSLSAMGVLLVAVILLDRGLGPQANWLLALAPIHLFAHMRGVYRTSIPGTLIRMLMIFMGSILGFTLIILGLISVGLSEMGGG